MRDYHHAKAMAHTLREALVAKSLTLSHSESLELIAQVLGFRDWNVLSAKIETEEQNVSKPDAPPPPKQAAGTLFCSFCGKSQHEVSKLIAGPSVFICDACVSLCDDIILDNDSTFALVTAETLRAKSTEELFLLKAKVSRGLTSARRVLELIRALSKADGTQPAPADNPQAKFFLRKTADEQKAYSSEAESRIAVMERAMSAITDALRQRG